MGKFDFEIPLPWSKDCVAGVVRDALNDSTVTKLEQNLNSKDSLENKFPRWKTTLKEFSRKSSTINKELLLELKDQEPEIVDLVVKILENPEIELSSKEIGLLKKMNLGKIWFANAFKEIVSLKLGRWDKIQKPDFYDYANILLKTLRKSIALHRFSSLNLSWELQGKEKEVQDLWINVFENPEIELDENQLNLFKLMHKQQEIFRKLYEEMNFFGTITHQNFNSFLYFKIYEQYFLTILINNIVEKTPKGHTIYSSGPKDSDGWEKLQVIVNDPSTFTYSIIDGFLIDGKEEVYDKHIPSYLDNIKLNIIKKKTI